MKNSKDTIGNQTRDLPACSTVPQYCQQSGHFTLRYTMHHTDHLPVMYEQYFNLHTEHT
jgi:hypothetical protein